MPDNNLKTHANCLASRLILGGMTFLILLLFLSLRLGTAQQNTPGCPPWTQWFGVWQVGTNVILNVAGLSSTYQNQITTAANIWNNGLASQGIGVGFVSPPATTSNGATITFEVGPITNPPPGTSPVSIITSTTYNASGYLVAATIRLDPTKQLLNSQGQLVNVLDNPTNILKTVLHELGHTLGLGHHPFDSSQPCGGQTELSVMNSMCTADAINMPITLTNCDKAGARESYFPTAPTPTPTPTPDNSGGNGFCTNTCPQKMGWWQHPWPDCQCEYDGSGTALGDSPILIDVAGNGFSLTSAHNGVDFDLNADGQKERIAWTIYGEDDAWLALDRNANGTIDSGGELFGNIGFENGFLQLTEYDKPQNGGNSDGRIDSLDTIFPSLRLWRDLNHNGISEAGELLTLADAGVNDIALDYKKSGRTDRFGNKFRYRAKVNQAEPIREDLNPGRYAYDVWLTRKN